MIGTGLQDWVGITQIFFNLLAGGAVLGAATKYILLSGGPRRHTELTLEIRILSRSAGGVTVETSIRIENKGIQLLEIYNVFLHATAVSGPGSGWNWSSENIIEPHDQKMWLHANTGVTINYLMHLPLDVDVIDLELVVPYLQRRLKVPMRSAETAKVSDYNSLHRYFSLAEE